MKICRKNALRLWEEYFGNSEFAEDFHGNLMCRDGYGDANFSIYRFGERIYCGWNIHHILPLSCGGTNEKHPQFISHKKWHSRFLPCHLLYSVKFFCLSVCHIS